MDATQNAQLTNVNWYTYTTALMIPKLHVIPGNDPTKPPIEVENKMVAAVQSLQKSVAALEDRPQVQPAPVDPAALAAALSAPAFVDAVAEAVADKLSNRLAD